ncbi:MAG: TolC family protein [Phycisphaeraceae bacterium]|nr:TolC family protein [Phycisphaeraceae bacterium]
MTQRRCRRMNSLVSITASYLSRRFHRIAFGLAAALVVGGCGGNPFATNESDYGRMVAVDRLRSIQPSGIESMGRPAEAPTTGPEMLANAETLRRRFEGLDTVSLTLEECRAAALERNLDLRVVLVNPEIAATLVSEEEAAWESRLGVTYRRSEFDSPTSSELASAQSRFDTLQPEVVIPSRTGGNVTVSMPVTRNENDNPFTTLNPAYTTDFQIGLSQQLLRGAGRRANTHLLRVASYNRQISEAQTKLEVIRQLAAVDRAYWRLFAAREALEVSQRQFELAQSQLETARRAVNAGRLAEIEVIRAQSGLASRLEAIINAQNAVLSSQRNLKRVINLEGLGQDTPVMVVTASPPDPVRYEIEGKALVESALAARMEMLELELRLAADLSQIDYAKNQALPLLAFDYVYRVNGLGDSFNSSTTVMRENNFEDWELGLRAEIPIGNEAAKSRVRRALLTRLQRLATREAQKSSISQEVLDAVDSINAGWQRIMAARQSVILNQRTLDAEQRAFGVGNSTSTDVLDAAARLADAQLAEIRAVVDYQIAQIDLAFATGTLLGASRVDWAPGEPSETVVPRDGETPRASRRVVTTGSAGEG